MPGIRVTGIDCHIGSQLTTVEPFLDAIDRLLLMTDVLAAEGITISHFDMGGGLGVTYDEEKPPLPAELMAAVRSRFEGKEMMLIVEPDDLLQQMPDSLLPRWNILSILNIKILPLSTVL